MPNMPNPLKKDDKPKSKFSEMLENYKKAFKTQANILHINSFLHGSGVKTTR